MNDSSLSSDSPTPPSEGEPSVEQSKSRAWQSYRRLKTAWKERREQRRQRRSKRGITTDPSVDISSTIEPPLLPSHPQILLPPLHTRPTKMATKLLENQNLVKHYFKKLVEITEISADLPHQDAASKRQLIRDLESSKVAYSAFEGAQTKLAALTELLDHDFKMRNLGQNVIVFCNSNPVEKFSADRTTTGTIKQFMELLEETLTRKIIEKEEAEVKKREAESEAKAIDDENERIKVLILMLSGAILLKLNL